VTLLKNEKGLLPLSCDIKTVAVIGPHADSTVAGFTAYTYPAGLQMLVGTLGGGETSVAGADASEREAPVQRVRHQRRADRRRQGSRH
jgi:beta-xylosidase